MTTTTPAVPARRPRRCRIARWVAIAAVLFVVCAALGVAFLFQVTPGVGDAETRVARSLAANRATDAAAPVPERIAKAVIAVEDARFRTNTGIDARGTGCALLGTISGGGDPGGSTIDQQLAKALYTGDGGGITKLKQVVLAVKLDRRYTKDQILEMYASVEYFGHGAYGITAAAATYFHRTPDQLDWAEAAMLAGLLQAPSRLDPIVHLADARARQHHVLDRLVATGDLTRNQADAADDELTALDR